MVALFSAKVLLNTLSNFAAEFVFAIHHFYHSTVSGRKLQNQEMFSLEACLLVDKICENRIRHR